MNAFNQVYEVSLLSVTLIALNCGIISSAVLRRSSEAEQCVSTAGKMARVYESLGGRNCQKKRQEGERKDTGAVQNGLLLGREGGREAIKRFDQV